MGFKEIFMSVLLAAGCFSVVAQETKTIEVFNPHWYVQGQVGGQYTLGEVKFKDLLSGNAQIAGGYQFTSVWGLRLALNAWQSKGGSTLLFPQDPAITAQSGDYYWKWNYVAPNLDATVDLTNLIGGYKYDRLVSVGVFAGIGTNIGWNNKEARDIKTMYAAQAIPEREHPEAMKYYWDSHSRHWGVQGHFGANVDFRVSDRVQLGLEVASNVLSDHYNSKKASNADWYFNALAGVKVNLGKTHKSKEVKACNGRVDTVYIEKIVEKPVEKVVEVAPQTKEVVEPLRRDIFYIITGSEVTKDEMNKVEDIVAYLKKYPSAKVSVTGYADKNTGNAKLNKNYAMKRAQVLADMLIKTYGIAENRVVVDSKGDTVQPYAENEKNRVTICIAQ